ncbi:hypothetical protein [Pseudobacillus wudalianchiensis]|uniref:Uncharacterized protein n=1 Tax=Pseudobacillus wudalianchiensis TaxID=1743143 RepID=A0A1B9ANC1_9BACI|nr:hypothetical protein [Bacillus wudalianchiensis]OCA85271.1 hypothetical protein A8F95_11410 [Bacillus wudalianchiensis]
MSLNSIRDFEELDNFLFENDINLRCKKTGLFLKYSEPVEGVILFLVLEDGSLVELAAHQLEESFEIVPLAINT